MTLRECLCRCRIVCGVAAWIWGRCPTTPAERAEGAAPLRARGCKTMPNGPTASSRPRCPRMLVQTTSGLKRPATAAARKPQSRMTRVSARRARELQSLSNVGETFCGPGAWTTGGQAALRCGLMGDQARRRREARQDSADRVTQGFTAGACALKTTYRKQYLEIPLYSGFISRYN
jgi:hypothetical protein